MELKKPAGQSPQQLSDVSFAARGRWHTLVLYVVGFWVVVGAGIIIASRFGAPVVWWDLIHPLTLGALTTAILAYSTHFAEALTRTATQSYRAVAARVGLVQVGLLLLLVNRAGYDWGVAADVASVLVIGALGWQLVSVGRALRGSLSGQFAVTVPYYVAAAGFMIAAVLFAMGAGRGLGEYSNMIAAHSRAMIWGFALLTIVGTVVTLLPTLTTTRISEVAKARCSRALAAYCVGLAAACIFYAVGLDQPAGLAQLLSVLAAGMVLQPVVAGVITGTGAVTGASASVLAGMAWLVAIDAADAASALAGVFPRLTTLTLLPAFLGAGLLQMVTGVLSHINPTLRGGGRERVFAGRRMAGYAWPARALLINLGGLLTLLGAVMPGVIMMGLGLIATLAATVASIVLGKKNA